MKTKLRNANICLYLIILGLLPFSESSAQTVITSWNYDPLQGAVANPTPNSGLGTSTVVNPNFTTEIITPGSATGMDATTGAGCGAQNGVNAWALNPFDPGTTNESNGVQFNTSTVGYQNIFFTWDQRWSNTSANTIRLQYTLDGSTWTPFVMSAANTTYCNGTINGNGCFETNTTGDQYRRIRVDFSSISGANNNANFGVRILAAYYQFTTEFRQTSTPTVVANPLGTWRFDNVSFSGTLNPGPTASAIIGTVSICNGSSTNLAVNITGGTGPFTLIYTDGTTNFTVNNYNSGAAITVAPTSTKSYTIVSVTNANGQPGTNNTGTATVTVKVKPTIALTSGSACTAVSFNLNTLISSAGNPTGGTGFFSRASSPATPIASPTAYTGATIPDLIYTYTFNGCSTVSNTVTFTRNTVPVITTQPSGAQTVCQGTAFAPINIIASGATSYQWYYNSSATFAGATTIPLSNTNSYTPPSSTAYGPRYFAVRATNACGGVNSTAWAGPFYVLAPSVAGTISSPQTVCADGLISSALTLTGNTGSVVKWQTASDAAFTTNVTDIALTATTLNPVNLGNITQTIYVRAAVQNGSCLLVFTSPIQILMDETVWNGSWSSGAPSSSKRVIFDADYSSTADLNACSVWVRSGNVTINSNHTLNIINELKVTGGTLNFENNASLVQMNNTINTGNITYKRDTTPVRRYDYTYWSSPVDAQIMSVFSPLTLSDKYLWFDPVIYNWQTVAAPSLTAMDIAKGYIIRAPQNFDPVSTSVFHGSFYGKPNNGDYSIAVTYTDATHDLNCLGNPYPSAIKADDFILANPSVFGSGTTLYFWTHNTPITNNNYTFSDYAVYNFTGSTGIGTGAPGANNFAPNGYIAAGQSFMIKTIASGVATFNNSMRVASNNDRFYRNQHLDTEKHRIWLNLSDSQSNYQQLLIGYVQNATNQYEPAYDGLMLEAGNSLGFYSKLDNYKLSIQGKSWPFSDQDTIALGYRVSTAGTYQISLAQWDGLFENQTVYLEDKSLGIFHNLSETTYSFSSLTGSFDERFVIHYTNPSLGIVKQDALAHSVWVFEEQNQIKMDAGSQLIKQVKMYDATGRILLKQDNINTTKHSLSKPDSDGLLLIEITTKNQQVFIKKWVQ